jgi:hypothetical protein
MMCVEAVWCDVSGSGVERGGGLNRRWDNFFTKKESTYGGIILKKGCTKMYVETVLNSHVYFSMGWKTSDKN